MKTRKLLSLVLAAVMLLGCMTVTAFAGLGLDEITLDQTAVTLVVGDTKTLIPTVKFEGNDVTEMHSEYIEWSSTAESVATVENGVVTAVKEGTTTITASRGDFSATCTVTVISGTANLDTDTNKSKDIDQNYTFKQTGDTTYTDVYKVKLAWTVTDIAATYASTKTWNPDTKTWDETKTVADIADQTATFTLTNYSSKKVVGTASFTAETALASTLSSATFDENNGKTIDTMVNNDKTIDETKKTTVPSNTITATLSFNKDAFAALSATTDSTKYGTYTVTISAAPTVTANYLTFTANEANSSVTPAFISGTAEYSGDGGATWQEATNGTAIQIAYGESICMRNKGNTACTTDDSHYFSMTGSIAASGDVTSLTNGIGGDVNLAQAYPNLEDGCGCYQCMFYECGSLTSAPNLPSTTLAEYCYCNMFAECISLTKAPALPATTLAEACYMYMFSNCESLTTAPALPAGVNGVGSLAVECYYGMFTYCYELENAPTLGATTLTKGCYNAMFNSCTSLTYAPSLPTTTLVSECYYQMFDGCTKLKVATSGDESNKIFTCPDTTGLEDPLTGMFDYTAGTFTGTPATGTTYYWYTE